MSERSLVDTNIVVYAYDPSDKAKHAAAQSLIHRLVEADRLTLSVQVLNEFYRAATRTSRPPSLSHADASDRIRNLVAAAFEVLPLTVGVTLLAIGAVGTHGLSLWDAVLWATAKENGIGTIYTEDTPASATVEGVRYVDPFLLPADR